LFQGIDWAIDNLSTLPIFPQPTQRQVSRLGVTCVHVEEGLNLQALEHGLARYRARQQQHQQGQQQGQETGSSRRTN
jgi:hypothetical protein